MIIKFKPDHTENDILGVKNSLSLEGWDMSVVKAQSAVYGIGVGKGAIDLRKFGTLSGVADIFRVSDNYKLVSRKWRVNSTIIDLGDGVKIGEGHFSLMLGPCSIESESQVSSMTDFLSSNNVRVMRGGAFKPRSSPYSFQGLGIPGLKIMSDICRSKGIKVVTEVLEPSQIESMLPYVDMFQVGARNNQNFSLLKALGGVDKPILLKRGISGTIEELLNSAEYIYSNGNEKILLCERGVRSYETAYRNLLDINAIPVLKAKTHLPVIVDPSHGIGLRKFVEPIALAAIMAGADGLIIESHQIPEQAYSDGQQTLNYSETKGLIEKVNRTVELRDELRHVAV